MLPKWASMHIWAVWSLNFEDFSFPTTVCQILNGESIKQIFIWLDPIWTIWFESPFLEFSFRMADIVGKLTAKVYSNSYCQHFQSDTIPFAYKMQICFELLSIVFHFVITTSRIFDPLHRIVIEGNLEFSCPHLYHHHCLFKGALVVLLLFKRSIQPLWSLELLLIEKKGVHIETETKQGHVEIVNMITCTTALYN